MATVAGSTLEGSRSQTLRDALRGPSRARKLLGFIVMCGVLYLLYLVQSKQIETFVVTSESMEPTLKVGEAYFMLPAKQYEKGQIVVFRSPEDHETRLVKRIAANGGDLVELREGMLYVNNQLNISPTGEKSAIDLADKSWKLLAGQFFMVGDNRTYSHDSREYGPVEASALLGVLSPRPINNSWWHRLSVQFVEATY